MKNKHTETRAESGPLDSAAIQRILPHRYPFLLIDRVLEVGDGCAVALKNVSRNEPFFDGHFPGRPVMPGVLMIEALAQTGAVAALSRPENKGKIAYLVSIDKARFRKVVVPGDQLRCEVRLIKMKQKIGIVSAKATVDGQDVCEAEIMFSIAD